MATKITNLNQLRNILEKKCIDNTLPKLAKEVEDELTENIGVRFYGQYQPKSYDRTYQMIDSIKKTNIQKDGQKSKINVYMDGNYWYEDENGNNIREGWKAMELMTEGYHGIENEKYRTEGRPIKETKEWVKSNGKEEYKKILQQNGINAN